jgi:2-polyprenyl-3-methyl-5-hydroxy-6-metoxy-1,4-benzoquinol methylase
MGYNRCSNILRMPQNESIANLATKPEDYYSQQRPEVLGFIPPSARRILDVGCGEGGFGAQVKRKLGATVWGIELMPSIADRARERLDRVIAGDILDQLEQLPDGYFDCITFNDVLEHLIDPYRVLRAVKLKLSPSGVVVASIPNIRFLRNLFNLVVRGDWRYEDAGILDKTHVRFFTKKSIKSMFESLGYRIIQLKGINATPSWKVAFFNLATLGAFSDTRYLQFCCIAEPLRDSNVAGQS